MGAKMKKDTKLVNAGRNFKRQAGSVSTPIHLTSTVLYPTVEAYEEASKGNAFYDEQKAGTSSDFSYGISGTPTTFALQEALREIEGEGKNVIVGSGLAAITLALYSFLKSGDHILVTDTIYGPTRRFCNKELKKYGIETTYYDPLIGPDIKNLIKENTKIVFLENPGSLTFEVQDVPSIVKAVKAKSKDIVTIIDNSWATSLYYKPFEFGVDVSIQALTKYAGGHSDIMLGVVSFKDKFSKEILSSYRNIGFTSNPFDCYLALRGLRTLSVRLKKHHESAVEVAKFLEKHKKVKKVLFPALSSDSGHKLWKRDFSGAGGLFTFILDKEYSEKTLNKFVESLDLFGIGCSWGGFESLALPINLRLVRTATKFDAKGSAVRLYIGLEDQEDLIKNLEKALQKL